MTKIYQYNWTCKSCGHRNNVERTKYEAAFDHSPKRVPCTECGGTKLSSAGYELPDIDAELLEAWYADTTLFFLDQDEDLIIAGSDLEVLKAFIEKSDAIAEREKTMGPIFAVKLYDNTFNNPEQRQWCVQWLAQNKDKWFDSTERYIIKKIKPILKREFKNDRT